MVTFSFGMYRGVNMAGVPEEYLCWVCANYKGGGKVRHAGEKPWNNIPEVEYLEARMILKSRGYNVKGVWPIK